MPNKTEILVYDNGWKALLYEKLKNLSQKKILHCPQLFPKEKSCGIHKAYLDYLFFLKDYK